MHEGSLQEHLARAQQYITAFFSTGVTMSSEEDVKVTVNKKKRGVQQSQANGKKKKPRRTNVNAFIDSMAERASDDDEEEEEECDYEGIVGDDIDDAKSIEACKDDDEDLNLARVEDLEKEEKKVYDIDTKTGKKVEKGEKGITEFQDYLGFVTLSGLNTTEVKLIREIAKKEPKSCEAQDVERVTVYNGQRQTLLNNLAMRYASKTLGTVFGLLDAAMTLKVAEMPNDAGEQKSCYLTGRKITKQNGCCVHVGIAKDDSIQVRKFNVEKGLDGIFVAYFFYRHIPRYIQAYSRRWMVKCDWYNRETTGANTVLKRAVEEGFLTDTFNKYIAAYNYLSKLL